MARRTKSDGNGILIDDLVARADAAKSEPSLMGSEPAAYARTNGWSRDELAPMIAMHPADLATLYCEPRLITTITPGDGVIFEDGLILGVIGRFAFQTNRAPEAYKEDVSLFALERSRAFTGGGSGRSVEKCDSSLERSQRARWITWRIAAGVISHS